MSNVSDGIAVFRLQDQRTDGGRGPGGGCLHRRPLSGVPVPREPADLLQEDLPEKESKAAEDITGIRRNV